MRHIREHLPHENLLYFADSGFAPYGDKTEAFVARRSLAIAHFLLERGATSLVVACNTATAAAIKALRERYPDLPLVGVEPGLKPAAAMTKSLTVGVLATERTLASDKFNLLREQLSAATGVRFLTQACVGLADQIEKGELHSITTSDMVQRYVTPLLAAGADTLVLGCTHYPFVQTLIVQTAAQAGANAVNIIDTGLPVTRQLIRLLAEHSMLKTAPLQGLTGSLQAFTSGNASALHNAFEQLLGLHPAVMHVAQSADILTCG